MKISSLIKHLNLLPKYLGYKRFVSTPLEVDAAFEITNRCTSQCEYCVTWGDKEDYLSTGDALSIINKLKEIGVVTLAFTGGEPLLRKDMVPLVSHAKGLDILTTINTNGMVCKESLFKNLFEAGLTALTFSLDGAKAETHETFRRKTSFKSVIESIKIAVALRSKYKYKTSILTNTVVNKGNISELEDIARLTKSLGVDRNHFQPVWKQKLYSDTEELKPFMSDDEFTKKFGFADSEIELLDRARDTILRIPNSIPRRYTEMLRAFYTYSEKVRELECFAGRAFIYVDKKGNLYPCGAYLLQFGSILHENPSDLLKTEKAKIIIQKAADQQCGGCAHPCYMERNLVLNRVKKPRQIFEILTERLK